MSQNWDAMPVKGGISEISTGGSYDSVYSENSSTVNLNPDGIEQKCCSKSILQANKWAQDIKESRISTHE